MNQSILLKAGLAVTGSVALHLILLGYVASDPEPPKVAGARLQVQFGNYHGDLESLEPASEEQAPTIEEPSEPTAAPEPEPQVAPQPEPSSAEPTPQREPVPEPEPIVEEALLSEPDPTPTVPETRPVQAESQARPAEATSASAPENPSIAPAETDTAPASSPGPQGQSSKDARADISSDAPAQEAGNAASSNYSGLVMRHLSRMRLPRSSGSGSAYVSFTVGHEGELETVEIARSSGSSRFDRDAIRVVQRAVPFPPPPPGVNRTFQIEIEGK